MRFSKQHISSTFGVNAPYVACAYSSLGVPFILFSDQLDTFVQHPSVATNRPYTPNELDVLRRELVRLYLGQPGSSQKPSAVVADFEGEMLGFGGEMTVATFLPYMCETTNTDRNPTRSQTDHLLPPAPLPGLCIDMTGPTGISLCKEIMEHSDLCKLVWGMESDCAAMLHQHYPRYLDILPTNAVDVQLRFSKTPSKRLALHEALKTAANTPHESFRENISQLPNKTDVIHWDELYARNKRAMPFPLCEKHLLYALDDTHRVDLVIRIGGGWVVDEMAPPPTENDLTTLHTETFMCGYDQRPYSVEVPNAVCPGLVKNDGLLPTHTWWVTVQLSKIELQALRNDPHGMRWFYRQRNTFELSCYNNHPHTQQLRRAVVIQRHIQNLLRDCGGVEYLKEHFSPSDVKNVREMHVKLLNVLNDAGVVVCL